MSTKHLDSSSDEDREYIPDSPIHPSFLARRRSSGRDSKTALSDDILTPEIPESRPSKRQRAASPENKSKPKCAKAAQQVQDTSSVLSPLANPPPKESMRGSLQTSKPSKPDLPFVPFAIDDYAVDGYAFNGYAIDGPVQDVHNESHTHELLDSMMRITKSSVGEDDTLDEEDLQIILDDAETTPEEREATSGPLGDCLPALDDHDADFADVDDDNQQDDDEDDDNDEDTMT